MNYLKQFGLLKTLDESKKRKLREQAGIVFVAAIWIGLFVFMLVCSTRPGSKDGRDLPIEMGPRMPAGSAKFL